MAKSQQSFNKKERDKKRKKKQKDKLEKRERRKMEKESQGKKSFEELLVYLDENGNYVNTPPDPAKKFEIKLEDIQLGATRVVEDVEIERRGKVKFFNHEKGYGFITDKATKESIFVHINNCYPNVKENHLVTYEVEQSPKGPVAVKVEMMNP